MQCAIFTTFIITSLFIKAMKLELETHRTFFQYKLEVLTTVQKFNFRRVSLIHLSMSGFDK